MKLISLSAFSLTIVKALSMTCPICRVARCGGPITPRGALAAVQILNEALFGTPDENAVSGDGFSGLQLTGNTQEYYVPENSFLNKVLEGRKGIPIT